MNRTSSIINELHILALIYGSASEEHRKIIDEKIARVEAAINEKISNQGWFSYLSLSRSNEVITL